MEEEVPVVLKETLDEPPKTKRLMQLVREHFGPLGGVDLKLPERESIGDPPDFS